MWSMSNTTNPRPTFRLTNLTSRDNGGQFTHFTATVAVDGHEVDTTFSFNGSRLVGVIHQHDLWAAVGGCIEALVLGICAKAISS